MMMTMAFMFFRAIRKLLVKQVEKKLELNGVDIPMGIDFPVFIVMQVRVGEVVVLEREDGKTPNQKENKPRSYFTGIAQNKNVCYFTHLVAQGFFKPEKPKCEGVK